VFISGGVRVPWNLTAQVLRGASLSEYARDEKKQNNGNSAKCCHPAEGRRIFGSSPVLYERREINLKHSENKIATFKN